MFFNDHGVGDIQPLTGALADIFGGEERIENPGSRRFGYAGSGILYANFYPVIASFGRDGDDTLLATFVYYIANRVGRFDDQIEDYLIELADETGD